MRSPSPKLICLLFICALSSCYILPVHAHLFSVQQQQSIERNEGRYTSLHKYASPGLPFKNAAGGSKKGQHPAAGSSVAARNTSLSAKDVQLRKASDRHKAQKRIKVTLPDNEDENNDDQQLSEKGLKKENYFLRIFAASPSQYTSEDLPKTSPIHFHFLYSSARRHIALGVLLI